jgi:hypothetical protein
MAESDAARARARATRAAGDWDGIADALRPIGGVMLERAELAPGTEVLDAGAGSGPSCSCTRAAGRPRRVP